MDDISIQKREAFEDRILESAPRMTREDTFTFACHPGVSCFGDCCGDVNIFLTPLDVLRLKNRLGMSSSEFLEKHTILPGDGGRSMPAPVLRMSEDEKRKCPFFGDAGCSVYDARPWACRMYPLGFASPPPGESSEDPFFFLVKEDQCHGFTGGREISVARWMEEQGVEEYDESGALFRDIADGNRLPKWKEEDPRKVQMFFMATYDIDTFRRFVFDTTFLDRFDVSREETERIRKDDGALLEFAFRWLRFSLLGEPTMDPKVEPVPEQAQ